DTPGFKIVPAAAAELRERNRRRLVSIAKDSARSGEKSRA
ncbi:MAG: hypothetical protein ACI9MB_001907, partial [Verrucomicrobiales bacterium]